MVSNKSLRGGAYTATRVFDCLPKCMINLIFGDSVFAGRGGTSELAKMCSVVLLLPVALLVNAASADGKSTWNGH